MKATPGRPVLTVIRPDDIPDHRHGPRWWWFRVTEAAGTVRWRAVVAAVAVVAATWRRGCAGRRGARGSTSVSAARTPGRGASTSTSGTRATSWRTRSSTGATGRRWDGRQFTLCCPLPVPDPAGLAAVAADVAAEDLEYSGAARARGCLAGARALAAGGGRWPGSARPWP